MKKIFLILIAALCLISCKQMLQNTDTENEISQKAYIKFSIKDFSRTILPSNPNKDDFSYELIAQKENEDAYVLGNWENFQQMNNAFKNKIELAYGNWIFILKAKKGTNTALISSITTTLEIGSNLITFDLQEAKTGNGRISINFTLPAGDAQKVSAALFSTKNIIVNGFEEETLTITENDEGATVVYEKENVPCGDYIVKFFIYQNQNDTDYINVKSELVHVAPENISEGDIDIAYLNNYFTIEYDLGVGEWAENFVPVTKYNIYQTVNLPTENNIKASTKGYWFVNWTYNGIPITEIPRNTDVTIKANWTNKLSLFTGTEERTDTNDGDTQARVEMNILLENPEAYIVVKDDITNGMRMMSISTDKKVEDIIFTEGANGKAERKVINFSYKCSDLLNMMTEEQKACEAVYFTENYGLKIESVYLTYGVKINFDGNGVDLGKTYATLPQGADLQAPDKHKDSFIFDHWENALRERIDIVPEEETTLYPVWTKIKTLFTGTRDKIGDECGDATAYILIETLLRYPDAFIVIEDDVGNGNRQILMSNNDWSSIFYEEECKYNHTPGIIKKAFKCSEILDMMSETDKNQQFFHIHDWISLKLKSVYITYGVNVNYVTDGGSFDKTSERIPSGIEINNFGRKESYFFRGWMDENGEEVTVAPDKDITLYPIWTEKLVLEPELSNGILITKEIINEYVNSTLVLKVSHTAQSENWYVCIHANSVDWSKDDCGDYYFDNWNESKEYELTRKYNGYNILNFMNEKNADYLKFNDTEKISIEEAYLTYSEEPDICITWDKSFKDNSSASRYSFFPKGTTLYIDGTNRTNTGNIIHINCTPDTYSCSCKLNSDVLYNLHRIASIDKVTDIYYDGLYIDELFTIPLLDGRENEIILNSDITIYKKEKQRFNIYAGNSFFQYIEGNLITEVPEGIIRCNDGYISVYREKIETYLGIKPIDPYYMYSFYSDSNFTVPFPSDGINVTRDIYIYAKPNIE